MMAVSVNMIWIGVSMMPNEMSVVLMMPSFDFNRLKVVGNVVALVVNTVRSWAESALTVGSVEVSSRLKSADCNALVCNNELDTHARSV